MIESYSELKAYISQYVLSDPRIPATGFLWGQSKRVLDAMASAPVYPYFWVENVTYQAQGYDGNAQVSGMWDLEISIKGNAMMGDVSQQEYWLNYTHSIMQDFIGFLMDEHNEGRIFFELSRFKASMREVYEPDDSWGWSFSVQLAYESSSWCAPDAGERYEVTTLQPVFLDGADVITIGYGVHEFDETWTNESDAATMLRNMADSLNSSPFISDFSASTDGIYLYLRSTAQGAVLTYETVFLFQHKWSKPFE